MSLDVYLNTPTCGECGRSDELFDANITHNLGAMADEAGIYGAVWRPEENDITLAWQLVKPLKFAIAAMEADPERFSKHNSPNGWGTLRHFLPWLKKYLAACEEYPDAEVSVWR